MTKKIGTDHSKHIARLRKIEGQIRGISSMVVDQRYCMDILNQLKAARSALRSLENKILEEHLNHCVHDALISKNKHKKEAMVKEIIDLVKKTGS